MGLEQKAMKGRWVRIKGGEIVGVKHGCTLPASQLPVGWFVLDIQWFGVVRNFSLYTRKKNYEVQSIKQLKSHQACSRKYPLLYNQLFW